MSYEEIEQVMGISYQTFRNYVYKAWQSLKAMLGSEVVLGLLVIGLFVLSYV